jgi:uncharacterized protein
MFLRIPFFGLLSPRSPMLGLVEHYDKISHCVDLIRESLECYISGTGICRAFEELKEEIDRIEDHADAIKRNIRNHLPKRLLMPVDKTLFLNYTKAQDNILDSAQEAMNWLGMRKVHIPEEFQKDIIDLLSNVSEAAILLGPALHATIALIHGETLDREGTKDKYRAVRRQRAVVTAARHALVSRIYNSDLEFKDIHQLFHFIVSLDDMSHNSENCADILRSMIAR